MRKVYDWVFQFLGVVFITVTVVPCALGFLLFAALFIGVNLLGWDLEPDGDAVPPLRWKTPVWRHMSNTPRTTP